MNAVEFPQLSPGNRKIGKILNWNLPAYTTCPGKSAYCVGVCYARHHLYKNRNVQEAYARRERARHRPGWVQYMIQRINRAHAKTVRIHASGDFDGVRYIRRWRKIMQGCPDTTFYFYTRSWRIASLLPDIKRLAHQPNCHAWFSCDRDTGKPPHVRGIRRAYMAMHDADKPNYKADLVLRVKRKTKQKRVGRFRSLVCPVEQGIERQVKITCESCGICHTDYDTQPKKQLVQLAGAA